MTTTWIKKGGDHSDPSQHVIVAEVSFYPAGGGFERHGKAEAFFAEFEPVVKPAQPPPLRPITVQIDDGPVLQAWTDGQLWNGWERPWVTREAFEAFVKEDEWVGFTFDEKGVLVHDMNENGADYPDDERLITMEPEAVMVEGQAEPVTLYDLSPLGFVWSKAIEEETEDADQ